MLMASSPCVCYRTAHSTVLPCSVGPPICPCRLFIASSGHGSPCLDLRRLSSEVADAAAGTDLGEHPLHLTVETGSKREVLRCSCLQCRQ